MPGGKVNLKNSLRTQLEKRMRLARGGRWRRFAFAPGRYLYGQLFQKFIYPRRRRGLAARTPTFWGQKMTIVLPAAMDVFLLGAKTHDSELRLSRFLIETLNPGDQVADIGAHYGFFSLLSAQLAGAEGRIEAFEAAGNTFQALAKNLDVIPSATARRLAISNIEGQLDFYEFPNRYNEYNTLRPDQFSDQSWFEKNQPFVRKVKAVSLDAFCREYHFKPDLIKMDVEGAEDLVVEGMSETLTLGRPVVVMEYLAEARNNQAHRRAARLLVQRGFQAFYITEKGRLAVCADIETYLRKQGLDSDNLVFLKKEK